MLILAIFYVSYNTQELTGWSRKDELIQENESYEKDYNLVIGSTFRIC